MENKISSETAECDQKVESEAKKPAFERGEDDGSVRLPQGSRIKERLSSALESGLWADCKFLVGESKEEVKACKMILSLASPVFSTMFFGSVPETGPVSVPDVEPEVFNKLLKFIYTHNAEMSSIEEALKVMVAADKYMLPDLIDICSDFCSLNFTGKLAMKDLCSMLETAKLLNVEKLQTASIRKVQELTSTLLSSAEFKTLSVDSLVSILRRGHLNIDTEIQLINAALGWASNRCEQRDISIEGKALRSVLEEVGAFKHLRFLALEQNELWLFESDPKKTDVLTAGEIEAIKKYHDTSNDESPPDSVCNLSKRHKCNTNTGRNVLAVRGGRSLIGITSRQSVSEEYTLQVSCHGPFYGVTIATQVRDFKYGSHYEEELTVNVSYNSGNKSSSGYFKNFVKYGDEVTVPFEIPGQSFQFKSGDRITVNITFWKAGTYPVFKIVNTNVSSWQNEGHVMKLRYR